MIIPPWAVSLGLKGLSLAQAAWQSRWTGWVLAALLLWPLSCTRTALVASRAELKACQDLAAAPKPASVEKSAASSAIKVTVRHGVFDTPVSTQAIPSGSSWPTSPCPDVVVEAGSQASFSREETPAAPLNPPTTPPKTELWADLGYFLGSVAGPQGSVRLEHGRGAVWLSGGFMGSKPTWGVGTGFCAASW